MTVLNPNRGVARIFPESLPIEPDCELPLPGVACAVGKKNGAPLPADQTAARRLDDTIQCHFIPNRMARPSLLARLEVREAWGCGGEAGGRVCGAEHRD